MAKYQVSTLGIYAKMLLEDCLHALDGEERVFSNDGEEWVKGDIDPKKEIADNFKELAFQLKESIESARAIEQMLTHKNHGMPLDQMEYMEEVEKERKKFKSDWEWIFE